MKGVWQGRRGWNHSHHSRSQPRIQAALPSPGLLEAVFRGTQKASPLLGEELTPSALSLLLQHRPKNLQRLSHAHLPLSLPLPGSHPSLPVPVASTCVPHASFPCAQMQPRGPPASSCWF